MSRTATALVLLAVLVVVNDGIEWITPSLQVFVVQQHVPQLTHAGIWRLIFAPATLAILTSITSPTSGDDRGGDTDAQAMVLDGGES